MALNFPDVNENKYEHVEFHNKIVDRAASLMVKACEDKNTYCSGRKIPDDAILLALCEEPEVQEYIEHLDMAGVNSEKLIAAIESDFDEAVIPEHASLTEKEIQKKDIISRGLSTKMLYILDKMGDPEEYDPVWYFHMLLAEKVAATGVHYAYTCKDTGAGLNSRNMEGALSATYELLHQPHCNVEQPKITPE